MRSRAVRSAVVAAVATWRLVLLLAVVLLPVGIPAGLLLGLVAGPAAGAAATALVMLYPVSMLVHELAHAAVALHALPEAAWGSVVGGGGWTAAWIDRPGLPVGADRAATMAGPFAGAAVGLLVPVAQLLAGGGPDAIGAAAAAVFATHLLALLPWSADGRALARTRTEKGLAHVR